MKILPERDRKIAIEKLEKISGYGTVTSKDQNLPKNDEITELSTGHVVVSREFRAKKRGQKWPPRELGKLTTFLTFF